MAAINLQDINKAFTTASNQEVHAIQNLSLRSEQGEFLVIVGPSGCGKTTALRIIAGLEHPDSGKIMIGNREVTYDEPKDRDIAMVFQHNTLYPHMTVYQNLSFSLKFQKIAKGEIGRRIQSAAKLLHIEELMNRRPSQLSGGQRQRVAIGKAIVRRPQVFLFDEPLSYLDTPIRAKLRNEIVKLHKSLPATMIYVTHDQVEAMTMGDRIAVMNKGQIQQIDTPLNLYHNPKNMFVARFIGSSQMSFLSGKISASSPDQLEFKTISHFGEKVSLSLPKHLYPKAETFINRPITLGLRTESIGLNSGDQNSNWKLKCQIEGVEPLGSETFIHAKLDKQNLIARTACTDHFPIDSMIELNLNLDKALLFDSKTEARL